MVKYLWRIFALAALIVHCLGGRPYEGTQFKGRIAYSADGNHNDPDDWAASPVALAIFAQCGVKDRLVHFDYNCLLPETTPEWEKIHAESVLGAAERYGFERSAFYDCRKDLTGALESIAKAINDSSEENPLYFVVAGPMEVPYLGIQKSDPAKRKSVYVISHSRWNDGFDTQDKFTHTKRSVIEQEINWIQIRDQNRLLSLSRYGQPAKSEQFAAFHWMRDSRDANVRFLWERMLASTRPDPSDAGMAYFLVTGDEECDPGKLRTLIEEDAVPKPIGARKIVRLEAENFRHLKNFKLEDLNDRQASHRLEAAMDRLGIGSIETRFDEPYTKSTGRYTVEIRYFDEVKSHCRFALAINGQKQGAAWQSAGKGEGWTSRTIQNVEIRTGDEIKLEVEGSMAKIDYVQLEFREEYFPPPEANGGWRSLVPLNAIPTEEQKEAVRKTAGLDWDKLLEAWNYAANFPGQNSILIIRHGWIAGEWHNFTGPRGIASCTKSISALAMAKLFDLSDRGVMKKIGLDDFAWKYLPSSWSETEPDRKKIQLRHLLTMTSGLTPYDGPYKEDYQSVIFAQTVEAPPGKVWAYASAPVDLLSYIVEDVTGRTLGDFFNAEICSPIGAGPIVFPTIGGQSMKHSGGSGGPGGGAKFSSRDLARVGYLLLHRGAWQRNGRTEQIMSVARVEEFTGRASFLQEAEWRQPNFANETNANRSYGYLFWNNNNQQRLGPTVPSDAFYMSGWGKQACFIIPSLDMVIVRLGSIQALNQQPYFYSRFLERIMEAVTSGDKEMQFEPRKGVAH